MFKKLKTKLTLLNLAVAGLILLGMSVIAFVKISDSIQQNSEQILELVTTNLALQKNNYSAFDPGLVLKSTMGIFPYVIIGVDENGGVVTSASTGSENEKGQADVKMMLSKEEINKIVQTIQEQEAKVKAIKQQIQKGPLSSVEKKKIFAVNEPNGIIDLGNDLSYRYRVVYTNDTETGSMMYIIMQDMGSEKKLLTNVGLTLGICVLGGLLMMALGGLFLAERSIRPIRMAWKKQREFVADASHELRTPLAAIIGNIDVVMDDPVAKVEEKQIYCQGIAEEAGRMSLLVDGLLMLARADSDALVLEKKPVDIAELVRSAAVLMQPVAAKKDIRIGLNIIDCPVLEGDSDRLRQVVLQLLDNAVKYTQRGGSVEIGVDKVRDLVQIKVRDTGIGIAPEHQGKIFERFFRVDPSREREVGGHGLGLAIVKYIVEHHGGMVSVSSEKGKGSTFTITLPAS